ncbi:VOC family protein [Rhodonellum sp.]|uniref:VOC family protein n=1 Tax=Rhodonellum sp. TaxID=2231180 RepID=UPI002728638B|nr:VOC family protein [Rhodonellum sp.]MDO9554455.1 VOC family protein [Rhodonellum sp.]
MKFEHFALNVAQPQEMSAWYVLHLGLTVVKKMEESPFMTFLADDSGSIMLEIYANPKGPVLDFKNQHPLVVHLAFVSDDPTHDKDRLVSAGATLVSDDLLEDGSHLVMLRDPWGLAIQFCKRAVPMIR